MDPRATLDPDGPDLRRRLADEQLSSALAGAIALGAQVQALAHDSSELRRETRDGFARMEGHASRTEALLTQLVAEARRGNEQRGEELAARKAEAVERAEAARWWRSLVTPQGVLYVLAIIVTVLGALTGLGHLMPPPRSTP